MAHQLADPAGFIAEEQQTLLQSAQPEGTKILIRALYTGEKRCPRKGEWFLSGSSIEAYQAKNDLGTEYHIARLALVKHRPVDAEVTVISTLP